MNLALVAVIVRNMAQAHMMRQSVDNSSGNWGKFSLEDQDLASHIVFEKEKLGVEVQGLGIVEVYILKISSQ